MSRFRALSAVAAILLALAIPAVRLSGQETRFFASDEAGFRGEPLPGPKAREYTLGVTEYPSSTLRILYRDGKELRRYLRETTVDGSRERVLEGERLLEERTYDRAGNLVEEYLYGHPSQDDGKPTEGSVAKGSPPSSASAPAPRPVLLSHLVYVYVSGRLGSVESFGASSESLGKIEYRYDPSGRLLELSASGSFGDSAAGLAPGTSLPAASWLAVPAPGKASDMTAGTGSGKAGPGPDKLEITRYDAAGRPIERASYEGDVCVRAEVLVYDAAGRLSLSRTFETATRTMGETTYDSRGRVVLVVTSEDGDEKSRESFGYDDASRLVERSLTTSQSAARTTYAYGGAGEKSRKTDYVDGVIVSVTVDLEDGSTVRELYDKGALFLRARYSDGRLRQEEFIEAGEVVRTRDYP